LLCVFSFHHDKNALDDHNVSHISSPPLISMLKNRLPSALLSAHCPLHPHHLSSHQAQAITGHLQIISVQIHGFRKMAPLLLSTRQQLQAPKPPPHTSIALKLQLMPSEKQEVSEIDKMCLF
jgi:hypothetical protein